MLTKDEQENLKQRLLHERAERKMTPEERESRRIKEMYEEAINFDWSPPPGFTGPWAG